MSRSPKPAALPRSAYADMFGPTTRDRIQVAGASLEIEIERDFTTSRFSRPAGLPLRAHALTGAQDITRIGGWRGYPAAEAA